MATLIYRRSLIVYFVRELLLKDEKIFHYIWKAVVKVKFRNKNCRMWIGVVFQDLLEFPLHKHVDSLDRIVGFYVVAQVEAEVLAPIGEDVLHRRTLKLGANFINMLTQSVSQIWES